MNTLNEEQVGGTHYKRGIQPITYIEANNLTFSEGNVVKYVTRHKEKNGREDLRKAKWYIDHMLNEETTSTQPNTPISEGEYKAVDLMIEKIIESGTEYDFIVYEGRGGLWAAAQVAYALDLDVFCGVDYYQHSSKYDILFVDDIWCTGDTGRKMQSHKMDVATLYYRRPSNLVYDSVRPDYFGVEIQGNDYIDLPVSQYQDIKIKKEKD